MDFFSALASRGKELHWRPLHWGRAENLEKKMSGLGWCLAIILSWAKFLFFCVLPFGKQRKNKVDLCLRNLQGSLCRSGPARFLFVSWLLVSLNEPEWLWLVVLWRSSLAACWPVWFIICCMDQMDQFISILTFGHFKRWHFLCLDYIFGYTNTTH